MRVDDLHAVTPVVQFELFDDQWVEEPDKVRAGAHEVGAVLERLLQCAGATYPLCPLEDNHVEARARGTQLRSDHCDHRQRQRRPIAWRGQLVDRGGEPYLARTRR